MKVAQTQIKIFAPLDIEYVFNTFTNFENYKKIPLILDSTLIQQAQDLSNNGLSAIREIKLPVGVMRETVVDTKFPEYWDYQFSEWIAPLEHTGGRMHFQEVDGGTWVTWSTSYNAKGIPRLFTNAINATNQIVLYYAATQLKRIAVKQFSDSK